jgi:hypothetical protein
MTSILTGHQAFPPLMSQRIIAFSPTIYPEIQLKRIDNRCTGNQGHDQVESAAGGIAL